MSRNVPNRLLQKLCRPCMSCLLPDSPDQLFTFLFAVFKNWVRSPYIWYLEVYVSVRDHLMTCECKKQSLERHTFSLDLASLWLRRSNDYNRYTQSHPSQSEISPQIEFLQRFSIVTILLRHFELS